MNTPQILAFQKRIGATQDGFWGPQSIARCHEHLRRMMPNPNPWPFPNPRDLRDFYGEPGDESNLVTIEFPFPMFYGDKRVTKTRVHKKCADSLLRVLNNIRGIIPSCPDILKACQDYGGCFNFRQKRGGSSWSLHAWGAAIDLDADDNTFRDTWPVKADMPLGVMEEFSREGWLSAGAFWGYDAMHFQATR